MEFSKQWLAFDCGTSGSGADNFEVMDPYKADLRSYMNMKKYLDIFQSRKTLPKYSMNVEDAQSVFTTTLQSILSPVCASHRTHWPDYQLIENNSMCELDVPELLRLAQESAPESSRFAIDASLLNSESIQFKSRDLHRICPQLFIKYVPRALHIQTVDSPPDFYPQSVTTTENNVVGQAVRVLNSDYEGGELLVTHGTHTQKMNVASRVVALHKDCTYSFTPVTSGARVSLLYDMVPYEPIIDQELLRELGIDSNSTPGRPSMYCKDSTINPERLQLQYKSVFTSEEQARLVADLTEALHHKQSVVITLPHLYVHDAMLRTKDWLKPGDRALHDLLCQHFNVEIVDATLHNDQHAALYTPKIVSEALRSGGVPRMDSNSVYDSSVVVAHKLEEQNVLENSMLALWQLNSVYVVSGLKVSKKD